MNRAKWREFLLACAFIGGAALPAHFAFSWMGFNPTDEGLFLAASRRLIDGQVAHRDFISPYPALTSILHAPEVVIGGDHVLWFARLVAWIEFAALAWCWTIIVSAALRPRPSAFERIAMALLAFAISVHTFQIMTWYTVDGLLATSAGIALRLTASKRLQTAAYVVIGSACLFKQSFLPAAALLLILFNDWRRPARVIATAAPAVAYALFLTATGALPEALLQCAGRTDISRIGLARYVVHWPFGAVLGLFSLYIAFASRRPGRGDRARFAGPFVILAPAAVTAFVVLAHRASSGTAFVILFGVVAGASYGLWKWFPDQRQLPFIGVLALVAGWCTSLSYGENNPGFAAGALCLFLVACFYALCVATEPGYRRARTIAIGSLSAFVVASVAMARYERPDADRKPSELRYALDGVFRGGASLRTNVNTYRYLRDMSFAVKRAGVACAILPDNAGVWVASAQPNPLSIDWLELLIDDDRVGPFAAIILGRVEKNPLQTRVIADIDRQRGRIAVLVQKVEAGPLFVRIEPLDDQRPERKPILDHVRKTMVKVDETEFFEIYR